MGRMTHDKKTKIFQNKAADTIFTFFIFSLKTLTHRTPFYLFLYFHSQLARHSLSPILLDLLNLLDYFTLLDFPTQVAFLNLIQTVFFLFVWRKKKHKKEQISACKNVFIMIRNIRKLEIPFKRDIGKLFFFFFFNLFPCLQGIFLFFTSHRDMHIYIYYMVRYFSGVYVQSFSKEVSQAYFNNNDKKSLGNNKKYERIQRF